MSFAYDSAACKITSNHRDNILQILIRKRAEICFKIVFSSLLGSFYQDTTLILRLHEKSGI